MHLLPGVQPHQPRLGSTGINAMINPDDIEDGSEGWRAPPA
jgi:hypothetical protein